MSAEIDPQDIVDFATQAPKRAKTDEGEVEERSVNEVIAADRYAKTVNAGNFVPWGLRMARTKPPGSV